MLELNEYQLSNLIKISPEFASEVKIKYPKIVADVVSFVLNPNCTCRKKVLRHCKQYKTQINKMAEIFLLTRIDLNINLESAFTNTIEPDKKREKMELTPDQKAFLEKRAKIVDERKNPRPQDKPQQETHIQISTKDLRGEIIEIEPNPAVYKNTLKHIANNNWTFSGISVIETEKTDEKGKVAVVWLLFFY